MDRQEIPLPEGVKKKAPAPSNDTPLPGGVKKKSSTEGGGESAALSLQNIKPASPPSSTDALQVMGATIKQPTEEAPVTGVAPEVVTTTNTPAEGAIGPTGVAGAPDPLPEQPIPGIQAGVSPAFEENVRQQEAAKVAKEKEDNRQLEYINQVTTQNPELFSSFEKKQELRSKLKEYGYSHAAIEQAIAHGEDTYERNQLKVVDKTEEVLAKKLLNQFGVETKDNDEVHQKVMEGRQNFGLSLLGEEGQQVFAINEQMRSIAGKKNKSGEDLTKWGQLNEERKQLGAMHPLYDMATGAIVENPTPEQIQDNKDIDERAKELSTTFKDRLGQAYNNAYLRYQYYNQKFTPELRSATLTGASTSSMAPFNVNSPKYEEAEELRNKWLDAKKELYAASRAYLLNEDPGAVPRGIGNDLKLVVQSAARTAIPQSLFLGDNTNQTNQDLIDGYHMLASRNSIPLNEKQTERMTKTLDEQIAEGVGGIIGLVPALVISKSVVGAASKALGVEETIARLSASPSSLNNLKAFVMNVGKEGIVMKGAGMSGSAGIGFGVSNELTKNISATLPGKWGTIVAPLLNKLMIAPASATAAMQVANLSESAAETLLTDKTFQDALKEHGYGDLDQNEKKLLVDYVVNTLYSGMSVRPKDFKAPEYRALANELQKAGKKEDAAMVRGWVDNMLKSDIQLGDSGLAQRESQAQDRKLLTEQKAKDTQGGTRKMATEEKVTEPVNKEATAAVEVGEIPEVNLPEAKPIEHDKLQLEDGETVNYQGIEGNVVHKEDGVYVRDYDGHDHIIESGQSGKTPAELGIKVMPPQTPISVERVLADREQNGQATYANKDYFVSLTDATKPDNVGDKIYEINPDGTYTERFVGKSKANRDRKLAIINKYLKSEGLPRRDTVFGRNAEVEVNEKMKVVHAEIAAEETAAEAEASLPAGEESKSKETQVEEESTVAVEEPAEEKLQKTKEVLPQEPVIEISSVATEITPNKEAKEEGTTPVKPVKGDEFYDTKKQQKATVTRVLKPRKGSALQNEPFLVDVSYVDGKKAINMPMTERFKSLSKLDNTPAKLSETETVALKEVSDNTLFTDIETGTYVYELLKDGGTITEPKGNTPMFEEAQYTLLDPAGGDGNGNQLWELNEQGKQFVEAVKARVNTRERVANGTDMFPYDANIPELKKELKKQNVSDESITHFENRTEPQVDQSEPVIASLEAKGLDLQNNADTIPAEDFERRRSELLSEIDTQIAELHGTVEAPKTGNVKRVTFNHAGSIEKGTVIKEDYVGATGTKFKYQVKGDNGRIYPLNERDVVSESMQDHIDLKIQDEVAKLRGLLGSGPGIVFDPKQEAEKNYRIYKSLVNLAKLYIEKGILKVKDFADEIGLRPMDVRRAFNEAKGKGDPVESGEGLKISAKYISDNLGNKVDSVVEVDPAERERMVGSVRAAAEGAIALAQGGKAGVKFQQAFQDTITKSIAGLLKGKKIPPLTERQQKSLINGARRVKTPLGVNRYMEYVDKVIASREYTENLKKGKSLRGKLRTTVRGKQMLANDVNAIKDFLRINPSQVENIAEYNDVASRLVESMKLLKAKVRDGEVELENKERSIANEDVALYVEDHFEMLEETRKAKLAAEYQDLVDAGVIDPATMTFRQMQELTEAFEKGPEAFDEATSTMSEGEMAQREAALRDYMSVKVEDFKEFINEQMVPGTDGTMLSMATPREKQTLQALSSIDVNRLDIRDLANMNNVINNIQANGDFSGAGQFEVIKKKLDYLDNIQSLLDASAAKGLKLGKLGGGRIRDVKNALNSVDLMFDELAQDDKLASQLQLYTGSGEVQNASTRTNIRQKALLDGYQQLLKEHAKDNVNTAESIYRRGVFSYAIQHHGEESMQADFDRQKSLVKQNYEKLLASDNERERKEGLLTEKAYNEILDGAGTAEEAAARYEAMDPSGKKIADYFKEAWAKVANDYEENTLLYHNKGFERLNEFTAQRMSKMFGATEMDSMSPNGASFNQRSKGPSRSTISRAKVKNLPPTRKIDLNFDRVQSEAYREALFDVENAKNVQVMDAVMNSPELRKMLGGENTKVLKDAADRMVKLQKGELQATEPYVKAINKALGVVTSKSVRLALGGVSQLAKQYLSVASNTALYLGKDMPLFFDAMRISNNLPLFEQFPIGDREGTTAGYNKNVDLNLASDANLGNALSKIFEGFGEKGEKLSEKILKPLTASDKSVARTSWLAYYMKSLKDQGIDPSTIDWATEHENPNLEAAAYAEQVVSKTQHVNTTSKGAELMTNQQNGYDILKNMFLPFSSFGVNQRVRMTNDIKRIMQGGNKTEAFKDLGATLAETAVFNALKVYAIGSLTTGGANMILSALGAPQKSDDDKFKKFSSQVTKDYLMNGMGALPEHALVNGTNQLGKVLGAEEDLIYNYKSAPGDPDYSPWGTYGVLPLRLNDMYSNMKYMGNTTPMQVTKDEVVDEPLTDQEKTYYRTMFLLEGLSVLGASDADLFTTLEKAKRQMNKAMLNKYGGEKYIEVKKKAKGEYQTLPKDEF